MAKTVQEWLLQADYDLETAVNLFDCGRFFYTVFMYHLSLEKGLKALYFSRLQQEPPKTHNLVYLLNAAGITPSPALGKFCIRVNEASVVTRYPEDLQKLQIDFPKIVVQKILTDTREALEWIKTQC